ncbi:unnamed protein product [Orchesella dallaii]|uniref:EF-hand domain-containing protein n=1 Tax=Orchesella dallaii TaxID=48710 RepID=A0ABP1RPZ5_9HEXA
MGPVAHFAVVENAATFRVVTVVTADIVEGKWGFGTAEFSWANKFGGGRCGDGTEPTPCCGLRACNFFCCNCSDGGCRGKRWIRDVRGAQDTREHEHDVNKDGFYDKKEIHILLLSGGCGNYTEKKGKWEIEFHRLDENKDGKLSYEEING